MARKKKQKSKTTQKQKQSQSIKNIINITTKMDRARIPRKRNRPARGALMYPTNDLTPLMMSMMINRNQQPPPIQSSVADSLANARQPLREQGQILGHGIAQKLPQETVQDMQLNPPKTQETTSGLFSGFRMSGVPPKIGSETTPQILPSIPAMNEINLNPPEATPLDIQAPVETSAAHTVETQTEPSYITFTGSPLKPVEGSPSSSEQTTSRPSRLYTNLRENYRQFFDLYTNQIDESINAKDLDKLVNRYITTNSLTYENQRPNNVAKWKHKMDTVVVPHMRRNMRSFDGESI